MKKNVFIFLIFFVIFTLLYFNYCNAKNITEINIKNKLNLKIALCISGRIDNIKYCYNTWHNNFLKYYNVDIFMHINDCSYDDKQFIESIIKPKKITYEDPNLNKENWYLNMNIMLYRLYYCNNLKNQYAINNNINYDVVIRMRPDITMYENLNLTSLLPDLFNDILYIPIYRYDLSDIINLFGLGLTDQFFISNNKISNIIANFYINKEKYKSINCELPEMLMNKYINDNNIVYNKFRLLFFLYQYEGLNNMDKFLKKTVHLKKIKNCL
jgi:hypothetical protein